MSGSLLTSALDALQNEKRKQFPQPNRLRNFKRSDEIGFFKFINGRSFLDKKHKSRLSDREPTLTFPRASDPISGNKSKEVRRISINSYWHKKAYRLEPGEIAPWKLPRDKHATISVIAHGQNSFAAVDEYLSDCEQQYMVEYIKRPNCSIEQAWANAMKSMNAQFHKRKKNVVLECLQFGGNKEFWDGFPNEEEITLYFRECYAYAIRKIGFLHMHENIVCAVIITEPNRRNLFVYYLPVTESWQTKVMSNEKNEYGTKLQLTNDKGEPLYRDRLDIDNPLLCHTEFWKQRGGKTSYSDLQEDFYEQISKRYGAERGKSTSLIMNTNKKQQERFGRFEGDEYDELYFDDSPF